MTLEEKKLAVEKERRVQHPLWNYPDNRKELRTIGERAMDLLYRGDNPLRPDVVNMGVWEAIPIITLNVLQSAVNYLVAHRSTDVSEVYLTFGKLFQIGIEYMVVQSAENANTFNPKIKVLDELRYDMKDVPYDDDIPVDIGQTLRDEKSEYLPVQFFEERETMYEIVKDLISYPNGRTGTLASDYGIVTYDWTLLYSIVVVFFRAAKEFLIEHKDDDGFGIELKLGRIIDFGISKNGDDEDDDYDLYVSPGQDFKVSQKHNGEGDKGV